jgi:hypothetical protein
MPEVRRQDYVLNFGNLGKLNGISIEGPKDELGKVLK